MTVIVLKCNHLVNHAILYAKDGDKMANSADPDQNAP